MIGLSGDEAAEPRRAMVRAFGGLVKVAGREWLTRSTMTRDQVHALLVDVLTTLVTDSLPRVHKES